MAAPSSGKHFYDAEQLVESCGAILFDLEAQPVKVCLIHHKAKAEWLLAKGRRNVGEHRNDAAVREVTEETGYACHLHPLSMISRQPPIQSATDVPDSLFKHRDSRDWFATQIRAIGGSDKVKQIWWYIAALDGSPTQGKGGENAFEPAFVEVERAVGMLSFEDDRALFQKAVDILKRQL